MVDWAHDATEGRVAEAAKCAGVRLAFPEEADTDAVPAMVGHQHRLAEIEDFGHVEAMVDERLRKARWLMGERQAGRGTDHGILIEGADHHAVRGFGVGPQVALLVVERAVVEIGKRPEHRDAQPCQLRQEFLQPRPGQPLEPDGTQASAPTWALQSARL